MQGASRRAWSVAAAHGCSACTGPVHLQVLELFGLRSLAAWGHNRWQQHDDGSSRRGMSTQPASGATDWMATIGRFMRPDAYDPHEQQLVKHFSSAKQAIGGYHQPQPWNQGGAGDHLDMFWNRLDVYMACMRSVKGFSHRRLLADASEVFRAVSYAVASQQPVLVDSVKDSDGQVDVREALASYAQQQHQQQREEQGGAYLLCDGVHTLQMIVPSVYQRMRQEARANRAMDARVCWELVELTDAQVVNAAMEQVIPESLLKLRASKLWVAQFTVRFTSKQRFWVEDKNKRVIRGSKTEVQLCEDYWVFERPLYLSWFVRKPGPEGARWRLVEQLDTDEVHHPKPEELSSASASGMDRTFKNSMWIVVPAILAYSLFHVVAG